MPAGVWHSAAEGGSGTPRAHLELIGFG